VAGFRVEGELAVVAQREVDRAFPGPVTAAVESMRLREPSGEMRHLEMVPLPVFVTNA